MTIIEKEKAVEFVGSKGEGKSIAILMALLLFVTLALLSVSPAQAAVKTWDGGGGTNDWSEAANWDGDVAPGTADVATFDGTSVKDVTIDGNINVAGIDINTGYAGTITPAAGKTITLGSSGYDQATGTFSGGDSTITISWGIYLQWRDVYSDKRYSHGKG